MIFTDTHTHLYSDAFAEDRKETINRAISNGVTRFFIPAIDSSYAQAMFDLEAAFPDCIFLMMGLHPTDVKPETYKQELAFVEQELARRKYYAVGEIGVDLYWDKTTLSIQQEAFQQQIQLAKKHQLPINIHCRDAFDEVFEVLELEKDQALRGIFHCFTGTEEQAQQAMSYNLKLGIGGVATFKNGKIDQFLNKIPLEHIVLETDSPYLAPVPFRGKRNESAYILNIAERLSELYELPLETIANQTTANSKAVFGI
ncbi:TatD family hydrolase [Myroides odoratus]|jgi:TatD DNase family protein|uniref:TatD family hydrolase n=1 Tax=Myroides odoratus TaxID=256 RepID=UPI002168B740|nr:TatD family hydrolase [Myroides odoratus]MCS4237282.1 TatD DNase family protein [Myroides odoratus]MDH6601988.1 TatD DNase family protein [Myroides gitamensis]MDR0223793.1 TatD family hydrolase [Myroides odoratus]